MVITGRGMRLPSQSDFYNVDDFNLNFKITEEALDNLAKDYAALNGDYDALRERIAEIEGMLANIDVSCDKISQSELDAALLSLRSDIESALGGSGGDCDGIGQAELDAAVQLLKGDIAAVKAIAERSLGFVTGIINDAGAAAPGEAVIEVNLGYQPRAVFVFATRFLWDREVNAGTGQLIAMAITDALQQHSNPPHVAPSTVYNTLRILETGFRCTRMVGDSNLRTINNTGRLRYIAFR